MKIDTNALNLTQSLQPAAPANPEPVRGQGHHHRGASGDQVQLSDLAIQLSTQASTTDPWKLAQLQTAFKTGTYTVSPDQVAVSIINDLTK